MDHKLEVDYPGGMGKLVEDLGNLRYDALAFFMRSLSMKIYNDSQRDKDKKRKQLALILETTSVAIDDVATWFDSAYDICKRYMK